MEYLDYVDYLHGNMYLVEETHMSNPILILKWKKIFNLDFVFPNKALEY